jgi:hypothetical protein
MEPAVDIAFDCLPLRSVNRIDVPLDASPAFRSRCEHLREAIAKHGTQNAYFLYNSRCVFRLANSDMHNMLRFSFEGTVLTDLGDAHASKADLQVELAAETCGSLPPEVLAWFHGIVERAVLIEFDRFILAGALAERVSQIGQVERIADVAGFAGMNV